MQQPFPTLPWRFFFMPLRIVALSGFLVIHIAGKANSPVTAGIWIAVSIALGLILQRGEQLPSFHRDKEIQRREAALAKSTMAKREDHDA